MDCIVLMPFAPQYYPVYSAIEHACSRKRITVTRVDRQMVSSQIPKEIFNTIADCRFVIADLTESNPNVFYELAIAHMFCKPVLHLMEVNTHFIFHLSQTQITKYILNRDPQSIRTTDGQLLSDMIESSFPTLMDLNAEVNNPITTAFETRELLKITVPWLYGYRKTYMRESISREVWIFRRTMHYEVSPLPYQQMIQEGIVRGRRHYKLLLPNHKQARDRAKLYWENTLELATNDEERNNIIGFLKLRFCESKLFDLLPSSIVLFDPLDASAVGILTEPMRIDFGTDWFDERVRSIAPESIQRHIELQENTYDIQMDARQTRTYVELFQKYWEKARLPEWI